MPGSLSLGYLLANIPHKERRELARQFGAADGELYTAMVRGERFREIFRPMTADQKRVLRHLLMNPENTLDQPDKTRIRGLEPFLDQVGMMFTVDGSLFRQEIIPRDYYTVLVPLAFDLPPAAFAAEYSSPRKGGEVGAWEVFEPLFELLRYAYHQPLELTANREIYKRHLNKILKNLSGNAFREIDALWQFSLWMELSAIEDRTVVVLKGANEFWGQPLPELLSVYLQFISHDDTFFSLAFFALAANLESDQWLDSGKVLQWLHKIRPKRYYDDQNISQYFDGLKSGGVWEVNGRLGRLTAPFYDLLRNRLTVEHRTQSLIIEPTGDILVPYDASWSERWTLAKLAGLVKNDRMTVYHVDKQAVKGALVHGELVETYITQLAGMSQTGLPTNIEANIRDWFRQLSHHELLRGTIIHSSDSAESLQLAQILKSFVRMRLSERDIIVDGQDLNKIFKKLDAAGQPIVPTLRNFDSLPNERTRRDNDFFEEEYEEFWEQEIFDDRPIVHVGRRSPQ